MKRLAKFILVSVITVSLLVIFYFFFPKVWGEAFYPLDYTDSIKKYSAQFGVEPNLVCAIIYTESHFNPRANSGVGARGLMQIMPATGGSIASELGEKMGDLYDPDTNIKYGTWYIKGLLDKYPGSPDSAIAAYNAGVARVDSYREGRSFLPLETQNFIKKVDRTKDMYDQVYGDWINNVPKPPIYKQATQNLEKFMRNLLIGQ